MRSGHYDEAELEEQLDKRGFLNRILGRVTRTVTKPWHMYPVGLLFGLGFDTVTEVGLLVVAGGAAASGLPWWAVLTLPGALRGRHVAARLDRRVVHELRLRVGVRQAGPQDLLQHHRHGAVRRGRARHRRHRAAVDPHREARHHLGTGSRAIASVDLEYVGYWIVGLFVVTWVVALLVWRVGRIEERWSENLQPAE